MSVRAEKVASVVKRALSMPISDLAKENNVGIATVTAVRFSPDLTLAKVYLSIYGGKTSPAKFLQLLEDEKFELRRIVSQAVRLKTIPDLKFFLDDTLDQMEHIQQLLNKAKEEDQKLKSGK